MSSSMFLYDYVQRDLFSPVAHAYQRPALSIYLRSSSLLPVPVSYHQPTDKPKRLKHIIDGREKPKKFLFERPAK